MVLADLKSKMTFDHEREDLIVTQPVLTVLNRENICQNFVSLARAGTDVTTWQAVPKDPNQATTLAGPERLMPPMKRSILCSASPGKVWKRRCADQNLEVAVPLQGPHQATAKPLLPKCHAPPDLPPQETILKNYIPTPDELASWATVYKKLEQWSEEDWPSVANLFRHDPEIRFTGTGDVAERGLVKIKAPGLIRTVFVHQAIGAHWWLRQEASPFGAGVVGDEMGLGKVVTDEILAMLELLLTGD
jgi:hypothetical protein